VFCIRYILTIVRVLCYLVFKLYCECQLLNDMFRFAINKLLTYVLNLTVAYVNILESINYHDPDLQ